MNFALKRLSAYCEEHSSWPSPVLYELERETNLRTLAPQMLSGKLQGQLFAMISKMIRPKLILEIGTFTGYAAICLAQGLAPDGVLHTIEANRELEYIIRKYIGKAGLEDKIRLHMGKAQKVLPELALSDIDLAFIDAGKMDYAFYYEWVMERLRPGGFIIADNVLWSGKVTLPEHDKDTDIIHRFNEQVSRDERVETLMLPMRDGLLLAQKK